MFPSSNFLRRKTAICRKGIVQFFGLGLLFASSMGYGQAPAWGVPPKHWDDFYVGLVNDFKVLATPVNEPTYWVNVIDKANTTATYTTADPHKKSVLYQYKYLNPDADTNSNWYQQQVISGLHIIDHMRMDGEPLGIRNAWVVYLLQGHDGGTPEAVGHLQDAAYMEKFFWNLKYVAQKSNGNKSIFIIEPDTWGYLIKSQFLGDASIGPAMLAYAGQVAVNNPSQFGYLAGLPNSLAGVVQGIVRTIRLYAPDAYVGLHANTWPCLDPGPTGVKPIFGCPGCVGRSGLVWRTTAEIDWMVNYQLNFYNGLFSGTTDKGDFLVLEKYGANAGSAGMAEWGWDSGAMQNWLYFSKKMGQGFCRPLLMWQIQLGQTNTASSSLGLPPMPNTSGRYIDTFVEYMFANFSQFLDAGFIGFMGGKGIPGMTEYSLQSGYGDNGYFFKGLNTYINPNRPYNLIRGVPQPKLGNDTTLCGTNGSLGLHPGNLGVGNIIQWSTGASTPTLTVTAPGTYWVKVGDGIACEKSDTIVISNTFNVNLGADQILCNPAALTLDAGHTGVNVRYVWQKNGSVLIGDTLGSLFVNQPGTYTVTVTDLSCMPAKTSQITLSANSVVPMASSFCFSSPSGSAALSVQNNGGTYHWYTTSIGGTAISTGTSYVTPTLSTATTYYVQDAKEYPTTLMPKIAADGFSNSVGSGATNGGQNASTGSDWLYFNSLSTFTLKSFKIDAIVNFCGGTRRGGIVITNTSTGFTYDSGLVTFPCSGTGLQTLTVSIPGGGVTIPKATNPYSIRYYSPLEAILNVYRGGTSFVYPRNYGNLFQTTGYNHPNSSIAIFGHPGMYDWNVAAAPTCARTPMRAVPCNPLELQWIAVKVNPKGNINSIEWSIRDAHDVDYFEVEKSFDGIHFSVISHSKTAAKGHEPANYSVYDASSSTEIIYYRVRGFDSEGQFYKSNIAIANPLSTTLEIVPNPSLISAPVYLKTELNGATVFTISKSDGTIVFTTILPTGTRQLPHIENLAKGVYILGFQSEDTVVYRKCVRE